MAKRTFFKALLPIGIFAIILTAGFFFMRSKQSSHEQHGAALSLQLGTEIPDLTLEKYPSGSIRLSSLKSKVILINFWATWCQACLVEMPSIMNLRNQFKDQGFEVAAVNLDEKPEELVPQMITKLKLDLPIYLDRKGHLGELFDIHGIPFTLIIDAERKVLHIESGDREWDDPEIQDKVKKWLSL